VCGGVAARHSPVARAEHVLVAVAVGLRELQDEVSRCGIRVVVARPDEAHTVAASQARREAHMELGRAGVVMRDARAAADVARGAKYDAASTAGIAVHLLAHQAKRCSNGLDRRARAAAPRALARIVAACTVA
jgi:hypothetical protein